LGIANSPLWQVRSLVDRGAVELLLTRFEPPPMPVHAVWPATRLLPAQTQLFVEHLPARLKAERPLAPPSGNQVARGRNPACVPALCRFAEEYLPPNRYSPADHLSPYPAGASLLSQPVMEAFNGHRKEGRRRHRCLAGHRCSAGKGLSRPQLP